MKIQRILLVFPPSRYRKGIKDKLVTPPLGLMYLAAAIKDKYEVEILDATLEGYYREESVDSKTVQYGLSYSEIQKRIALFQPEVVGVSCLFSSQFPAVREICRLAKEVNPLIVTVVGGSHPTFLARNCLADRNLDFIVLGEGEVSFSELLQSLRQEGDCSQIDGLAFRKNGQIVVNPKTHFIEDLDSLPFPARELVHLERYFAIDYPHGITPLRRRNTTLITSRGCPGRCTFCPSTRYWGYRVRGRSPEGVVGELEYLRGRWEVEEVQFEDDNLTYDRGRVERLFRLMVERGLGLRWAVPNGVAVWTLDEGLLDLMVESGCYELTLGFESGSWEVLRGVIRKPLDLVRARELVRYMQSLGIRTVGYFIIGFPGETRAQIMETLKFIEKLSLDKYNVFIFNPLPGSLLSEELKEQGIIKEDWNFPQLSFYRAELPLCELSPAELEKIVWKEMWKSRFRLLRKSPIAFFQRYRRGIWVKAKHFVNSVFSQ